MSWATRSVALVIAVAAALGACNGNSDDEANRPALEQARADLLGAIGVLPLTGKAAPDLGVVKSKDAPEYVVATGRLPLPPHAAAAHLSEAVQRVGFTPVEPREPAPPRAVAAVRESLVARIAVYEQLGSVRAEPGEALIQLQLGKQDPRLVWTQVGK